jgi:ABC-type Na+ efflux pump permease subunit
MAQESETITSAYDLCNIGGKMKTLSLTNTMVDAKERPSLTLVSTLQSTLLVFLLFFPVTFMSMFLHEAGHALFHLSQGVPVDFLYAHPFSFVGFVRPMADYNNVWVHASGTVIELLVSVVIFVILWKHRSFYTLPFLMVFPWVALYDGMGGIFDILGHTGDYHNILTITGWTPVGFYIMSPILIIFGIFFLISLFPLLGIKPQNRKASSSFQ